MPELIGAIIGGRYELRRLIGRGAMGAVYLAEHIELQQEVAIKVLDSIERHRSLRERFLREARMAGSFDHPNLVRVFDLGTIESNESEDVELPYCVMEHLRGRDLQEIIGQRAPLDPLLIAEWLEGVGAALDLIHAHGILHRDIKPENLFLAQTDAGKEALKVLDFGIAGYAAGGGPAEAKLTMEGSLIGTPEYMAPETARTSDVDHRSDVYSLGVVAFEALTGNLPFDAASPIKTLALKTDRPAPTLSEQGTLFSPSLELVIGRVLEREPRRRYPTAGAFVRDLGAAVRGDPLSPKTIRAHATPVGGAGAVLSRRPESMQWRVNSEHRPIQTVLVIDDEQGIRELASTALARIGGLDVLEASDGAEGVRIALERRPDVILLDLLMESMSGGEALSALVEGGVTSDTPIIVLTARTGDVRELLSSALPVAGVIRKPFDPLRLARQIREIVSGQ